LCHCEEELAFGDGTAPTLLIFSYTENFFSLYHMNKKRKRLAFFGEKVLVSV
jgi:sulfite exporter TauE/SafE